MAVECLDVRAHKSVRGHLCLQAAIACFEPKAPPSPIEDYQAAQQHAKSARAVPAAAVTSSEAAYFRCGAFSSANPASTEDAQEGKARKPYPLFAADATSDGGKESCCTKHQYSSGLLGPGLLVRVNILIAGRCHCLSCDNCTVCCSPSQLHCCVCLV